MEDPFTPLTPEQRQQAAAQIEWAYQEFDLSAWKAEQRARAPEILATLRRYLPREDYWAVVIFLTDPYGRDCIGMTLLGAGDVADVSPSSR